MMVHSRAICFLWSRSDNGSVGGPDRESGPGDDSTDEVSMTVIVVDILVFVSLQIYAGVHSTVVDCNQPHGLTDRWLWQDPCTAAATMVQAESRERPG